MKLNCKTNSIDVKKHNIWESCRRDVSVPLANLSDNFLHQHLTCKPRYQNHPFPTINSTSQVNITNRSSSRYLLLPAVPQCKTPSSYHELQTKNQLRVPRPTAAQVQELDAYPDTIWNLTPSKSGRLPVAKGRGGPFMIDWEVHGTGDIKLVVCWMV
jgi:hypothetical protein